MVTWLDHKELKIAKEILAVQTAAYKVESKIIDYENIPPLKEDYLHIQSSEETFLGIYSTNRLAAVISYLKTADSIEICRLVVHPSLFGQGLATKLLLHLFLKNANYITVCTAAKNTPALRLYNKLGFTIKQSFEVDKGLQLVKLERIIKETAF